MITNLDIYFSSACNQNCPYCCMNQAPQIDNNLIRQALADGSFVQHVKNNLTEHIKSIGFQGLEPSLNGEYFANFIQEILGYSSYIRYIIIPTNGTSQKFMEHFIIPVHNFCIANQRKIKIILQINLDGPRDLQNSHCPNTFDTIIQNLQYFNNVEKLSGVNKWLKIQLTIKPTLRAADLTYNPYNWYKFMRHDLLETIANMAPNIDLALDYPIQFTSHLTPTIEVPGNYTKQDGINLCKWDIPFDTSKVYECAAGITSKTIDYQGNVYDCHMLCNKATSIQDLRPDFENKMNRLVLAGEVIEQNHDKLFNAISSIYCWATGNNEISESYIKLLGNGAVLRQGGQQTWQF